jgi:hypothetical protein
LKYARTILEDIGLEGERLGIFFMSGSQGQTFAAAAHTMTERTRKLGPNPLKELSTTGEASLKVEAPEQEVEEELGFRGRKGALDGSQ